MNKEVKKELENIYNSDQEARLIWERLEKEYGRNSKEVKNIQTAGYSPIELYNKDSHIKRVVDFLERGIYGSEFCDIANSLKWKDQYMVLADFSSYQSAQAKASGLYKNSKKWYEMSAINIANAGYFSADRAISQYAKEIWDL